MPIQKKCPISTKIIYWFVNFNYVWLIKHKTYSFCAIKTHHTANQSLIPGGFAELCRSSLLCILPKIINVKSNLSHFLVIGPYQQMLRPRLSDGGLHYQSDHLSWTPCSRFGSGNRGHSNGPPNGCGKLVPAVSPSNGSVNWLGLLALPQWTTEILDGWNWPVVR